MSRWKRDLHDKLFMFRYLLCLLGILLALPILALIALAFVLPITISGIGYLLACVLAVSGLIIAPRSRKYSFVLTLLGVVALVLMATARLVLAGRDTNTSLRMIVLPQGNETRWINYVIDEQDNIIFGEVAFHLVGGDSANEHKNITSGLHTAYSEMRATQQIFPSPVISTYLNLQRAASFDTIMIEPEINRHPEIGVVFLHGYMGNVTVQCWEIAQAIKKFGAVTVCPSTDWRGQWWQPQGETMIRSTLRYLREQGVQKFYVGGFSNGGFGLSFLASKLRNENGLNGLFFIDGISNGTSIRETGLPILIIQGAQDERMPAAEARQTAEIIGDLGTYVELQGDHFIIIKQPDLVQKAIVDWLKDNESFK